MSMYPISVSTLLGKLIISSVPQYKLKAHLLILGLDLAL